MKIRSFLAAVALLITSSAVAQQYKYTTVPGDPMQARIYTLGNGLKVYLSVNVHRGSHGIAQRPR